MSNYAQEHCLSRSLRRPVCERDWSDQLFATIDVMKDFIDDRDYLTWAFKEIGDVTDVEKEITSLMERSCYSLSEVVFHFSRESEEPDWPDRRVSLLLHFFRDQFETRQRLLMIYWEKLKDQEFLSSRPELANMGASIGMLCKLIEQCVYDEDGELRIPISEATTDAIHFTKA